MARTKKPTPLQAFNSNIADADQLAAYARAFKNKRARRMRKELRERVDEALKVPAKKRAGLDCLESDHLFVVLKPDGTMERGQFDDLRPLLRQAIVAASAALETYVADKVMQFVGQALRKNPLPRRLREITLTVGHWVDIEKTYERGAWGIRDIVEEDIREMSSTAPSRIGEVLAIVGVKDWTKKMDAQRAVRPGATEGQLQRLTDRRNRIAHSADRRGQRRAAIELSDVEEFLTCVKSVVNALDVVLKWHKP